MGLRGEGMGEGSVETEGLRNSTRRFNRVTPKQFYAKVAELREAQRSFFRSQIKETRAAWLQKSKQLEAEVDAELAGRSESDDAEAAA